MRVAVVPGARLGTAMIFQVAAFWVMLAVAMVLGGAMGFVIARVGHECPAAGLPQMARPPGETPVNDDTDQAALGVYAQSRISMLDDLAPPRLLDVAILLSLWHPDAIDAALVMTARGPLELGSAQ